MFIKIISVQYFTMFSLSLIDTYILPPPPPSSSSFELNVAKAGGNQKIKLYWFGGGGSCSFSFCFKVDTTRITICVFLHDTNVEISF